MKLLTSEYTIEELHELSIKTFRNVSDGVSISQDGDVNRVFTVNDLQFFSLTDDEEFSLINIEERVGLRFEVNKLVITPEILGALFLMFESVTDMHESIKHKEEVWTLKKILTVTIALTAIGVAVKANNKVNEYKIFKDEYIQTKREKLEY